jgi:DNA gyrase subunit A
VASFTATTADQLMLVTDQAKLIRIGLDSLRVIGRGSAGCGCSTSPTDEHIVSAVPARRAGRARERGRGANLEEMIGRDSPETAPEPTPDQDDQA